MTVRIREIPHDRQFAALAERHRRASRELLRLAQENAGLKRKVTVLTRRLVKWERKK